MTSLHDLPLQRGRRRRQPLRLYLVAARRSSKRA